MRKSLTVRAAVCLASVVAVGLIVLPLFAEPAAGDPAPGAPPGAGWLSLLPPLIAIVLALVTRDVLLSLFLGVFSGALILAGWQPVTALARTVDHFVLEALIDPGHAPIVVFTTLLGGMVGLVTKCGGTTGIVERLTPYATSARRGQIATWIMGVLVFFDDYANTLIVGPTMRPITDRLRISREKLAYIVDSTAAPVVCLFPISTWIGFELGLIGDAFRGLNLDIDAYGVFLHSLPYRFYPIFALVLGFTIAATRFEIGPMRLAEKRARETGAVLAEDARPIADYSNQEMEPPADVPKRAINAVLPVVAVISVTLIGLWMTGTVDAVRVPGESTFDYVRDVLGKADSLKSLMWASTTGILVAVGLILVQRLLKLTEAMSAMVTGFKAMMGAIVILILAWSLGAVCTDLQTAQYLVHLTEGVVSPAWLPALTFTLAAVISFATGTSWGTMGILEPLVIPICHKLTLAAGHGVADDTYMLYMTTTIAAVLAGSVWGDHCSPISDTTILSSMGSGCDHIAHVRTQLPYALAMGLLGLLVGSIPTAVFGLSPIVSIALGVVVILGGARFLAHRGYAV